MDRMSLEHDSSDSSGQLQIKIQGTEKLELMHLLATEQFRREISDLEDKHSSEEAQRQETIQELTDQVTALEEENGKLQASLDKLRKQQAAREAASALESFPSAAAV